MLPHVYREYNFNRVYLSCLGIWPFQSRRTSRALLLGYFVIQMGYLPILALTIYDHWTDMQILFDTFYQGVLAAIFIGKIINEIWHRSKLQHLLKALDEHWNIFTSKSEVRILQDYAVVSRKFTLFYSLLLYCMLAVFFSIPLTPIFLDVVLPLNESRPRTFAILMKSRLDQDKYYAQIYCYHVVLIGSGASVMASIDTMYVAFAIHACSLFTIINRQLEQITSRPNGDGTINKLDVPNEQALFERYILCLKKHQLVLDFVSRYNSIYQIITLFLLLLTGATISLVGIRMVYVLNEIEETIRYSFVIIAMLIQLLIMCYSGQKLIDKSQDMFHQAYAAKWYEFSPRMKSLLVIALYRGIVPCGLTAGKMIPLSMMTYGTVLRTALSYFMTFLSLKQ